MKSLMTNSALVIRLDKGDEIFDSIKSACIKNNIKSGIISGIGTLQSGTIGVYSLQSKQFNGRQVQGFFEISHLSGNVTNMNGEIYLHLHTTLANVEGQVISGHLQMGTIAATAEIFVVPVDAQIDRRYDERTGLNILNL